MIVTVFRSRLRPEHGAEYVNIIEFTDADSQRAWATEARHLEAKKRGRAAFYQEYSLQVCELIRESRFVTPAQAGAQSHETAGSPRGAPAE